MGLRIVYGHGCTEYYVVFFMTYPMFTCLNRFISYFKETKAIIIQLANINVCRDVKLVRNPKLALYIYIGVI